MHFAFPGGPAVFSIADLVPEQQQQLGSSLWISDPFDASKNVARSTFNIRNVQAFFAQLRDPDDPGFLRILSFLPPLD